MDTAIKINHSLKMELKKKKFIEYFKEKLQHINVDENLNDVLILLIRCAEDDIYKKDKKLGHIKQQAVLDTIKQLIKKPLDDKQLIGIINSIVENNDIRRTICFIRWYKLIKAYFLRSN